MTALIRYATPADLSPLHELVQRAYRGDSARAGWTHEADLLDGQRTDAAALSDIIGDPAQRLLVAERGGRLVGCVTVSDQGAGRCTLGMLSVDPALQSAGLGRRLIVAAEACARGDFGADRMEMTVIRQRAELIAWYGRRGYEPSGEERPFPAADPRFGLPRRDDLAFMVLSRDLSSAA